MTVKLSNTFVYQNRNLYITLADQAIDAEEVKPVQQFVRSSLAQSNEMVGSSFISKGNCLAIGSNHYMQKT